MKMRAIRDLATSLELSAVDRARLNNRMDSYIHEAFLDGLRFACAQPQVTASILAEPSKALQLSRVAEHQK